MGAAIKVVLDCQKCGGPLTVTDDQDIFRCPYCATPYLVRTEAGSLRISRLREDLDLLTQYQARKLYLEREIKHETETSEGAGCYLAIIATVLTFLLVAAYVSLVGWRSNRPGDLSVSAKLGIVVFLWNGTLGLLSFLRQRRRIRLEYEKERLEREFLRQKLDVSSDWWRKWSR